MRTWRQGSVARLSLPDGGILYLKCLKYPLARLFSDQLHRLRGVGRLGAAGWGS